jgi:sugar/nucleoside kinase (ribokinase family)
MGNMEDNYREAIVIGDGQVAFTFGRTPFQPRYGTEIMVSDLALDAAGSGALCAMALARLGVKTALVAKLGNDWYGHYALEGFRKCGVDTSLVKLTDGEKTSISAVIVRESGARATVTYDGTQGTFTLKDVEEVYDSIRRMRPKVIHVGGFFLLPRFQDGTLEVLSFAKDIGAITSFDTCWDPEGWPSRNVEKVCHLLPYVDYFLPNQKESEKLTAKRSVRDAAEVLLEWGTRNVVVKVGAKGCYLASKEVRKKISAFKVQVVDTDGAGDAFNAGFICGLVRGFPVEECAVWANAAGALKTAHFGLDFSFLNLADVLSLAESGRELRIWES